MRRRSRLVIGSLLIGGSTCLGIALTSTSASPALTVAPAARSFTLPRAETQEVSGAATLMVLGTVVAAGNVMLGRLSRRGQAGRRATTVRAGMDQMPMRRRGKTGESFDGVHAAPRSSNGRVARSSGRGA